jgi:hypothetical protein
MGSEDPDVVYGVAKWRREGGEGSLLVVGPHTESEGLPIVPSLLVTCRVRLEMTGASQSLHPSSSKCAS